MRRILFVSFVGLLLAAWLVLGIRARGGARPAAAAGPADPTTGASVDWLQGLATTGPATREADGPPVSPFADKANPEVRTGTITLSDNERIRGQLATTREKPIRIWVVADKEYRDIPFTLIKSLEAKVLWERDEPEWHFKASGSDIKEYSGKTYPARELEYTMTLVNGQTITGGIVAPIYLLAKDKTITFVLNKRQKGDAGQTLKELTYIKKLDLE